MNRRIVSVAVAAASVLPAVACTSNSPGDLNAAAAKVLRPAVENVRQAAATGTYADLRQAVQRLKDLVRQEEQSGDVSSQRAIAIENAADVLLTDARPTPSPTPSTTSPTPTPTPTSESPTPTPTPTSASPSASPSETTSPTPTNSPAVSVSAAAESRHTQPSPSASASSSTAATTTTR